MVGTALAGLAGLLAAYLFGNPRLYFLWALMFTIPFDLSKSIGPNVQKMGGETSFRFELSDPFLLALAAYLVRDIWNSRRVGFRIPRITYWWIAIIAMGTVQVLFGRYQYSPLQEVVRMIKVMLLFLVIANELETPRRFLHCASGLILGLILQASVGLVQYYKGATLGLEFLGETNPIVMSILGAISVQNQTVFRISGLLLHPNLFGIFLAVLLPLAIGLLLCKTSKVHKFFFLVSILLGVTALIGTLSRSSWLSFTTAFGVLMCLMIFHQRLRRRSLLTAVAVGMAVIILGVGFSGPIIQRIFQSSESAMLGREVFEADAKRMIAVKPWLGWGLNTYTIESPAFSEYGPRKAEEIHGGWIPVVHHTYLLWWAEMGILGLALHLALLAAILGVGIGNLRVQDEMLYIINAACLGSILAFMVDGFFSFSLRVNPILRVFWVLVGIMAAIRYWRLCRSAAEFPRQAPDPALPSRGEERRAVPSPVRS
ncbi:MAG: O-antigen ligase family protein [Terriglobia bacterium]